MTYRELIYICLDEIKQISNDSIITEDHVKFLANQYRYFLLYQKKQKEGILSLSTNNEQTICLNLSVLQPQTSGSACNTVYLKSNEVIPDLMDSTTIKVTGADFFGTNISFVTKERFKYVGYNKWMSNIIYCCLGADHRLYFKGGNPQFKYLKEAKLTGVFEDVDKANELSCTTDSEDSTESYCNPIDKEFPIDKDLVPQLIELVVKELLGVAWRQQDSQNNSSDDLANLMAYINKNVKSPLQKQIEG